MMYLARLVQGGKIQIYEITDSEIIDTSAVPDRVKASDRLIGLSEPRKPRAWRFEYFHEKQQIIGWSAVDITRDRAQNAVRALQLVEKYAA